MNNEEKAGKLFDLLPSGLARRRTSRKLIKEALDKVGKSQPQFHLLEAGIKRWLHEEKMNSDGQYIQGLHIFIKNRKYDNYIEDRPDKPSTDWRDYDLKEPIREFFDLLSDKGVPDKEIERFFFDKPWGEDINGNPVYKKACGVALSTINCDRGEPPTLVFAFNSMLDLFMHRYSLYAETLGYNRIGYTKAYYQHVKDKKANKLGMFANEEEFEKGMERIRCQRNSRTGQLSGLLSSTTSTMPQVRET